MRLAATVFLALLTLAACEGNVGNIGTPPFDDGGTGGATGDGGTGGGATGGGGGATGGGGGATGGGGGGGGTASCSNITGDRRTQVCLRWTCDRADRSEGAWNGSTASCTADDMSSAARANTVKLINLYRFIADLPPVSDDATRDQKAQDCALMMDAANALSHTPDGGWPCYTAGGAEAAAKANISTGRAVASIDLYMSDDGSSNATSLGHRRWLLSNSLGPVGVGGTTGGSCHWVIGGSGNAAKAWLAYPPPGPVPLEAINIPGVRSVDGTGWSVQSDSIDLSGAQVAVSNGTASLPVTVTQLGAFYGSRYAIRFNPQGWTSQAGTTYSVSITGVSTPITYDVQVVSCP